jgi:hypothetical protein
MWLQEALELFIEEYSLQRFKLLEGEDLKNVNLNCEVVTGPKIIVVTVTMYPESLPCDDVPSVEFLYTPAEVLKLFLESHHKENEDNDE